MTDTTFRAVCAPAVGVMREIPRAAENELKGGWRLDVAWLQRLQREVEDATKYQITLECLEETVIRTEAILALSPVPDATVSAEPPEEHNEVLAFVSDERVAIHDVPAVAWQDSTGAWWAGLPQSYIKLEDHDWKVDRWQPLPDSTPRATVSAGPTGIEAAKIVADYLAMRSTLDEGDAANIIQILHQSGVHFASSREVDREVTVDPDAQNEKRAHDDARLASNVREACAKVCDRWIASKNLHEHLAATDIKAAILAANGGERG